MLPSSNEIMVVCEEVLSLDIDLNYRFMEMVTDAFPDLGSRGAADGPLALISRIYKSTNR
jgi:hypothetical protein